MGLRTTRLKTWAEPRKGAIIVGSAFPVLALVALGTITQDWVAVLGGLLGLTLGAGVAMLFIAEPRLWEPRNRWRVFVIFVGVGTLLILSVFGILALLLK
jgi:uncharacterized membrane protein YkgB